MRGLLIGTTVAVALIHGVLAANPAHADESDTGRAFAELVFAGAPLATQSSAASTSAVTTQVSSSAPSSSISSPPAGPAGSPALESLPQPPELGPQVAPQLPDIPNPLDWFSNLDPRKWAGDILNAILTMIGQALLEAIRGFIDWALGFGDSSLNFVTRTPAEGTYGSPTVRSLWDFSRALVNVALAVIVMWGAFLYMSASGSPHQMERGKAAIVNALAGLAIVLMARVIAGMIQSAIGS